MTRRGILGSTALVAVAFTAGSADAADPIRMNVGGYYQFFALAGSISSTFALDSSSTQYKGLAFSQKGEIHFSGQTKLDNGTSVGLLVALEAWNPPETIAGGGGSVRQIDEAYIFAFGDWGRIELGARDQASYRMYYGAPSALLGFGFLQHTTNFGWAGITAATNKAFFHVTATTIGAQLQDVNRINYFTPRIGGLQIGVGYAPKISPSSVTGPGLTGGSCGFNDATAQINCPTNDYTWQDFFDVGVNYLNKFGDLTVALYGAFMYANFVPGYSPLSSAANLNNGSNLAPWKQWVVGAQFAIEGITIGGAVGYDTTGHGANYFTGVDNETRFLAVSVMYESGPWQISVGWVGSRNNNGDGSPSILSIQGGTNAATFNTNPGAFIPSQSQSFGRDPTVGGLLFGEETAQKIELGANYALAPGVRLVGGFLYFDLNGPSNAVVGKSWATLLGMDLRF